MDSKNILTKYGRRWLKLYGMEEDAENVISKQTNITGETLNRMYRQINKWSKERGVIESNLTQKDKEIISNECSCPMFDY